LVTHFPETRSSTRIAVIAPPWYPVPPSGYGGIEGVVALLADGLTDRGHEAPTQWWRSGASSVISRDLP
jgi:hypothetical protein